MDKLAIRSEAAPLAVDSPQTWIFAAYERDEDSFGYDLARQIYVLCEGMGGMAAGKRPAPRRCAISRRPSTKRAEHRPTLLRRFAFAMRCLRRTSQVHAFATGSEHLRRRTT